jgi:hypothetical protein
VTVFLRDMSHYDTNTSLSGFVGATHKVTEGTSFVDPEFAARLTSWRNAGVKVLGSYHVLHSSSLSTQMDFWLSTLDRLVPWWRTFPHWVMQIDAERWPTDNVQPATVKSFAVMLVNSNAHGWKVTYASRSQYGDQLAGIPTDLWNANYTGGPGYPGDNWATGWAPYSGRTPVLLQYTDTPFDKNGYRGTEQELLDHIGGTMALSPDEARLLANAEYSANCVALGLTPDPHRLNFGNGPGVGVPAPVDTHGDLAAKLDQVLANQQAILQALAGLSQPPVAGDLTVTGTLHVQG